MKFNQRSINFIGGVNVGKLLEDNPQDIINPIAIISPHAGYVFSGDIAASIFNTIDPEKEYENVFILSTSHTSRFFGAAILDDNYQTPYGEMIVNQDITKDLLINNSFLVHSNYFSNDHTIEVILPFIQNKIKYKYIFPIMIGEPRVYEIYEISNKLKKYLGGNNLFIISSDFSHYPSYDDAIETDFETLEVIKQSYEKYFVETIFKFMNKDKLVTRMCGWSSYLTLLHMFDKEVDVKMVKYKNSGDSPHGGKDSVVGYFGISFSLK